MLVVHGQIISIRRRINKMDALKLDMLVVKSLFIALLFNTKRGLAIDLSTENLKIGRPILDIHRYRHIIIFFPYFKYFLHRHRRYN